MNGTAPVARERMVTVGAGLNLCCRDEGERGQPVVLLIAGLGQQLVEWPSEFIRALRDADYRVIRFDNREVGCSSRTDVPAPNPIQLLSRRFDERQYDIGEMELDTLGLLDRLDVDAAHVVGMSMGGMIAQALAARHPSRVISLTSIMSTTGARRVGRPTLGTWARLLQPPAAGRERSAEQTVAMMRHVGSRGFPFDEDRVRAVALQAWDRDGGANPDGPARQIAAILKSGDRTGEVRQINTPTLVIHGDRDPMVNPTGGSATSRAIAGSTLLTVPGMGHDLPAAACPGMVTAIVELATAAEAHRTTPGHA
jgi:pimeloyl-ACP methyl ester carboxylesterase